jgi:Tfp pilus assembly protein PilF
MFRSALGLPDATERAITPAIGLIDMTITGCAATASDWYGRGEAIYLGFAAATRAGDQTRAKSWRERLQREYPGHELTARALACDES